MDPKKPENINEFAKKKQRNETFGVRHTLAIMIFAGYLITFAMRNALSVAIVAMVNNTVSKRSNNSEFGIDTCPITEDFSNVDVNQSTKVGEFNWSEQTKGLLLGAFYYGYILTNLIGGRAGDYWGGRYVFGISVLCASIAMIAAPMSARISPTMLFMTRILQGASAGFGFPTMSTLLAKWYPPNERSTVTAFIFSANQIGIVLSMFVTGWLSSAHYLGGWSTAFYLFGGLGIVWVIVWFLLISEKPQNHPRISDTELQYIIEGCPPITERLSLPWKAMLTSPVVWTIVIAQFGISWDTLTLVAELPTYLDRVLHLNILDNGIMSSLPFLCAWIFSLLFSFSINKLFTKGLISMLSMRRIAMAVSGYIPAIGMIIMCFTKCNVKFAVTTFIVVGSSLGAHFVGVLCSSADIAPRFAGTILGLSNTFSCVAGFTTPSLTSAFTQENHTLSSWRMVFFIMAALSAVPATIYILFITTDVQPFNDLESSSSKRQRNETCDPKAIREVEPVLVSFKRNNGK